MEYKGRIDTIDRWRDAEKYLRDNEYRIIQTQYDIAAPQGYHVIYWNPDKPNIEIITYSEEVYRAISEFERSRKEPSEDKEYKRRW